MSPFLCLADVLFRRDGTLDPAASFILETAVRHAARRLLKTDDDVEDILQELYLQLFRHHVSSDGGSPVDVMADKHKLFCSCVHVATNRLTDLYRKTSRVQAEDPSVLDTRAGLEQIASEVNDLDLGVIGHKKTEEVMRHLLEGRTVAEIAKAMHMTPRNVLLHKQRGVDRLNKRINRDYDDHSG